MTFSRWFLSLSRFLLQSFHFFLPSPIANGRFTFCLAVNGVRSTVTAAHSRARARPPPDRRTEVARLLSTLLLGARRGEEGSGWRAKVSTELWFNIVG